jgi:hypothetical protein
MMLQRRGKKTSIIWTMDTAMNNDVTELTETGEDILTCDASDAALERAAGVTDQKITTYVYCTYAWYVCGSDQ